jgi:protein-ribulosamine 3-kinase
VSRIPEGVVDAVESILSELASGSVQIQVSRPIGGGCINPSVKLRTTTGEAFFLKWNTEAPPKLFPAEAEGLRALHECEALRIPLVIAHSSPSSPSAETGWLLLEFIDRGNPGVRYAEQLGEGLAMLHRVSAGEEHGWPTGNYIGPLPQKNDPAASWTEFWWEARLKPRLDAALRAGRLHGTEAAWEALRVELPEWLAPAEIDGHSLLHGDLWNGNVIPDPGGAPVLIDPAVYRGHREVDLAMTELFGGFGRAFYDAYERAWPLEPGFRARRRSIYQLYPLLVHVNLFGGSYEASVRRSLDALGVC